MVTVVAVLIALIICCVMAKKKRARTGVLMGNNNQPFTTTNTVVYSGKTVNYMAILDEISNCFPETICGWNKRCVEAKHTTWTSCLL